MSDATLASDVLDELIWDDDLDSSHLNVSCDNGRVLLGGTVPTYWDRFTAENDAWRVGGVQAVDNDIVVDLGDQQVLDDDLRAAAVGGLNANRLVPKDSITVSVYDGWVTMEGNVAHHTQRQAAEHVVKHLRGLRGFTDKVTVSRDPAKNVSEQIAKSLQRSALVDAGRVHVSDEEGVVTLTGFVRSYAEQQEVERSAWQAPGVVSVVDRLVIDG